MAVRARRPNTPSQSSPPSSDGGGIIIPKTVTDIRMSLRPEPIDVTFGGLEFTIPAKPAADWLGPLLVSVDGMDMLELFPGLLTLDEQDQVWETMIDNDISMEVLGATILEIIGIASGRPWWVALRLVTTVGSNWPTIGAEMLMRGVDAERMSFSGWLDVALLTAMRNMKKEDATMFSMKLEQVPPSEVQNQPEPEISAGQFMSMA